MEGEVPSENGSKSLVVLNTEVANGIKHAVATLDESSCGKVSKSQLQAVVANVCQAIKVAFVSDDLDNYLPEKEELSVTEFLEFLESKLLVKGKKLNPKELDELSWVVVGQKYDDDPHMLTKKDTFKLWLVFKKLDVAGELRVDVEEICIVLEKFVRGIGVQWNEQHLVEFTEDGALTFWKFVDCLERKFLIGVEKNVLREGLQELYDFIIDEVTRTGFLYKKGHSMLKSQKSRWFVLKPDKLSYYVSSGYREKKGDVILKNEAKVTSIPDKGSNKCRFLVTCGLTKKDYEQTAPDQRTKQAWMTDIQTAIDCFGGQTPLKRDLLARKAKRDEDRARKAEEERKRREQEDLLDQQRKEIDLLKKRKDEIEKFADEEKAMLDAEIKRREELEELQRNLQQLLEDQKRAREEDEKIRAAKERLLEEERVKREQLEALRLQQQQELQNEKMQKEELMEKQKEQERILEEERKRLQHLEEERMKAEEAAKAAKDKLAAAETAAKNAAEQAKDKVRQLKTSIGLKGTVGPKVDPLVSHRGKGAFTLEEFLNRATEWSGLDGEEHAKPRSSGPLVDELVKSSATPASNQNIPEFLKKAAAWSGLNPETYLEGAELEEKKNSPPPKVAAKPPKPLPTAAVNVSAGDSGVSQESGQEPQEGEQESQGDEQGLQVEEKEGGEVKGEEKVKDDEVLQVKDEVSEGAVVGDDGSQVKDDLKEVTSVDEEGCKVEAVGDKEETVVGSTDGSEVADSNDKGSDVPVVDNDVSEMKDEKSEEVVDKVVVDEVVEEKESKEGKNGSEVVEGNDEGTQVKDEDNESSTEEKVESGEGAVVNDEKSFEIKQNDEERKSEEEKKDFSDVVIDENTEIVTETADSEKDEAGDDGQSQPIETSSEVKEGSMVSNGGLEENNEKTEVNNEETEVNNAGLEVKNEETEVNNEETEVNNEKTEVKNEETEVNNEETEVKNGEAEVNNGESEKPDTSDGTVELPSDSDGKDNIVENGHTCEETAGTAEDEHPCNVGDTKSELSEKCANNSCTENVEGLNS